MEPVDLVLRKYLLEAVFWLKAILFEVVSLDSKAVISYSLTPIDDTRIEVEFLLFFHAH